MLVAGTRGFCRSLKEECSFNIGKDEYVLAMDNSGNVGSSPINSIRRPFSIEIISSNLISTMQKVIPVKACFELDYDVNKTGVAEKVYSVQPYVVKNRDNIERKMASFLMVKNKNLLKEVTSSLYTNVDFKNIRFERMLPDSVSRSKSVRLGIKNGFLTVYTNIPNQFLELQGSTDNEENKSIVFDEFVILRTGVKTITITPASGSSVPDAIIAGDYINFYSFNEDMQEYLPLNDINGYTMQPIYIYSVVATATELTLVLSYDIPETVNDSFAVVCRKKTISELSLKTMCIEFVNYGYENNSTKEDK
jgi:hypothetical protein